jgi:DNA end-binding protein Ku
VAPRANWKGFLKVGELNFQVALYTAASTSDRIAFHTLNRATGHRVRRQFVDEETGDPVPSEEQVKGYEVSQGDYVVLEPEEVAAAVPESDKVLGVEAFLNSAEIDDVYFDRPYYLAPVGPIAEEAFIVLREGMRKRKVAALARAVLFRRVRNILITPYERGMMAMTLKFDYEVRSAQEAFSGIPEMKISGEMLDLAKHIIETKRGTFDPREFHDRYEQAIAELVRAKLEGRPIEVPKAPEETKVVNLMDALRKSAGLSGRGTEGAKAKTGRTRATRSKAKPGTSKTKRRASGEASHRRKAG